MPRSLPRGWRRNARPASRPSDGPARGFAPLPCFDVGAHGFPHRGGGMPVRCSLPSCRVLVFDVLFPRTISAGSLSLCSDIPSAHSESALASIASASIVVRDLYSCFTHRVIRSYIHLSSSSLQLLISNVCSSSTVRWTGTVRLSRWSGVPQASTSSDVAVHGPRARAGHCVSLWSGN